MKLQHPVHGRAIFVYKGSEPVVVKVRQGKSVAIHTSAAQGQQHAVPP